MCAHDSRDIDVKLKSIANKIRTHVNRVYIEPVRKNGGKWVIIRAGDIHAELRLEIKYRRMLAIDAKKFATDCHLSLKSRTGPKQSSSVTWEFDLLD